MMRQILVALDGSNPSKEALEYALEYHPNDEISVLHVDTYRTYTPYNHQPGKNPGSQEEYANFLLSIAEELAKSRGVSINTEYARGDPVDEITEYVSRHPIDLAIIGNNGRSRIGRFSLSGSNITPEIVRRVHAPVTIVSPEND